jgi:hypothetical protein
MTFRPADLQTGRIRHPVNARIAFCLTSSIADWPFNRAIG